MSIIAYTAEKNEMSSHNVAIKNRLCKLYSNMI